MRKQLLKRRHTKRNSKKRLKKLRRSSNQQLRRWCLLKCSEHKVLQTRSWCSLQWWTQWWWLQLARKVNGLLNRCSKWWSSNNSCTSKWQCSSKCSKLGWRSNSRCNSRWAEWMLARESTQCKWWAASRWCQTSHLQTWQCLECQLLTELGRCTCQWCRWCQWACSTHTLKIPNSSSLRTRTKNESEAHLLVSQGSKW